MSRSKTVRHKTQFRAPIPPSGLIRFHPGKGLMVSTRPEPFPQKADEKVICAKNIVQAMIAASDSGALTDANYDVHWPLSVVVDLLEQAVEQIDHEETAKAVRRNRRTAFGAQQARQEVQS
jgi:hypothetical protein